jgi:hypothetical protein
VEHADVARLAAQLKEDYAPERLDTGVTEPTVVETDDGFRALVLPREQMFEPFRSLHLLDAVAVGDILVVTFRWDDGHDDGTVFLMPLDTRDVELDLDSDTFVTTFLDHHLSFTLGGPRSSWEPERATRISERLSVVRPHDQGRRSASTSP